MNKYRSLSALLQALSSRFDDDALAVSPRWQNDEQAVGLYKPGEPGLNAYIYIHGQLQGRFGVQFEYPEVDEAAVAGVPLEAEDLPMDHLVELLVLHFGMHEAGH
jgi:hypothetical protein